MKNKIRNRKQISRCRKSYLICLLTSTS